jgi:hypothetical protein
MKVIRMIVAEKVLVDQNTQKKNAINFTDLQIYFFKIL